jgi:hypothetical protein
MTVCREAAGFEDAHLTFNPRRDGSGSRSVSMVPHPIETRRVRFPVTYPGIGDVYIDDDSRPRGTTHEEYALPLGCHEVRIVNEQAERDESRQICIDPGQPPDALQTFPFFLPH